MGIFNLHQGDCVNVYKYLKERNEEKGDEVLSVVLIDRIQSMDTN